MNIYRKKFTIKIVLFTVAVLLVGASLWYSNVLVNKIKKDERKKVELWSKAVVRKAALVEYTGKLFESLRQEEEKKVRHWLRATKSVVTAGANDDIDFYSEIISDNTTIPIVIVDQRGGIVTFQNIENGDNNSIIVQEELAKMKLAHSPYVYQFYGQKQYLYYRDSRLVRELEQALNELINSFISETVINNASSPVILTDSTSSVLLAAGNIEELDISNREKLQEVITEMATYNEPIKVQLNGRASWIYYQDSYLLIQLPYVQLFFIIVFLIVSYLLFSTFRNAEQNQVWVGMAKETAHQIGTPLSSMLAWSEVVASGGFEPEMAAELKKDVTRLDTIAQRFSKIGSVPDLKEIELTEIISNAYNYLHRRMPRKVKFELDLADDVRVMINPPLFEWVIENLVKNAVDAMRGEGSIIIRTGKKANVAYIEIQDTGSGMSRSQYKRVFEPGYTSKKRGWGLGLSLCKRIVSQYHKGKIFVKSSEIGKGSTFRIELKAC
mgnify:CR=1 FL=1